MSDEKKHIKVPKKYHKKISEIALEEDKKIEEVVVKLLDKGLEILYPENDAEPATEATNDAVEDSEIDIDEFF